MDHGRISHRLCRESSQLCTLPGTIATSTVATAGAGRPKYGGKWTHRLTPRHTGLLFTAVVRIYIYANTLVRLEWSSFKSSLDMYRESPSTTSVPDLTCTGVTRPKSPSLYWPFLTKMFPGYMYSTPTTRARRGRNTSGRVNAVDVDSGRAKPISECSCSRT